MVMSFEVCIYPKYTISTTTIFEQYKSLQFGGDFQATVNNGVRMGIVVAPDDNF